MNLIFSGRNVKVKDSFKEQAAERLAKLDRFFAQEVDCRVLVTVLPASQKVEITLPVNGFIYRAEQEADEMEQALEIAVDKLVQQIVKNKSKLEKKGIKQLMVDDEPEEDEFHLVRTKRFAAKPMSVDEAILQMNQLGHTFFLFLNPDTDSICLVYRRKDGDYALLEPELM